MAHSLSTSATDHGPQHALVSLGWSLASAAASKALVPTHDPWFLFVIATRYTQITTMRRHSRTHETKINTLAHMRLDAGLKITRSGLQRFQRSNAQRPSNLIQKRHVVVGAVVVGAPKLGASDASVFKALDSEMNTPIEILDQARRVHACCYRYINVYTHIL